VEAIRFAKSMRAHLVDQVQEYLRSWPTAIECTGPLEDRLHALLLAWELTGEPVLIAEIDETWRELVATWDDLAERWIAADGRR
jgi:hypothetical protein